MLSMRKIRGEKLSKNIVVAKEKCGRIGTSGIFRLFYMIHSVPE